MGGIPSGDHDQVAFQDHAHTLRDELEPVLADAYGDVWLDWSGDVGRLKVAVTTRCDPSAIAATERLISDSPISEQVDLVTVIWSARELDEAKERLIAALGPPATAVTTIFPNPEINSLEVWATDELRQADLRALERAIQAAAVSVRVVVNNGRWMT